MVPVSEYSIQYTAVGLGGRESLQWLSVGLAYNCQYVQGLVILLILDMYHSLLGVVSS